MVSRLSYTSDKTRDIGDYLDKSLRSLERQKAILEGAEDVETRRKALAAIGSQSAVLARHLAPAPPGARPPHGRRWR